MSAPARINSSRSRHLPFSTYWISRFAGSVVFLVVAIRKLSDLADNEAFAVATVLLSVCLLLYILEPFWVRRGCRERISYYGLQGSLILALGWLKPYEDTWGMLYLPLSMSIWYENLRREAILWSVIYTACMTGTLFFTFGWFEGLGFSLSYIAASAICISFGDEAIRAEKAEAESQKLLAELKAAHTSLEEFASQADRLAASREHERLVRELHDSISQTVFSLTLMTESTRLLLKKDPGRVPGQLGEMQALTANALGRMRALISQWKMG